MLKDLLESAKLDPHFCAELVRVAPDRFEQWLNGSRPIPPFAAKELSAVLGVSEAEVVTSPGASIRTVEPPAIWYKLRDAQLLDSDREVVGAIRRIGMYLRQLRRAQGRTDGRFLQIAELMRVSVDRSLAPTQQAKRAAEILREQDPAFAHGRTGLGEMLRMRLRHLGVLVFESPIKNSRIEGCSFNAGLSDPATPCLFANSYKSTWFRRNYVIAHELCHLIFDLEDDQISIDYKDAQYTEARERRADAFAQELLVPREMLIHLQAQRGFRWAAMTPSDLAHLIAATHVEKRILLTAARAAELIDDDQFVAYASLECVEELREISEHALATHEYVQKRGILSPKWTSEHRRARIRNCSLTLPVGYVKDVLEARNAGLITTSKAAEMLLIDRYALQHRFSDLLAKVEE
jgi:Zn-dependent peptidase ImmA (M78 family)